MSSENFDEKNLGKNLRIARINLELSQEKLAEKLGVSTNHISKIERGYTPSLSLFISLSNELGISPNELLSNIDVHEDTKSKLLFEYVENLRNMLSNNTEILKNIERKIDENNQS